MTKKQLESYEAPTTNVLELGFEGIVCVSGGGGINGIPEDGFGDLDQFIIP